MSRITSVIKTNSLDEIITGFTSFNLSDLNIQTEPKFPLPTNLRLGHLIEKVVSKLIKSATNYNVLYENIQVIEDKKTIGEIDFIIEEVKTNQVIHMELAYKFYLFDPTISSEPLHNWIGPNRNDSLKEKLEKLKNKQFPLLQHKCTKEIFNTIAIDKTNQALCLLASLFIPYQYKAKFHPAYEKLIRGYYINLKTFINLDDTSKMYHIPSKKKWGMNPHENEIWSNFIEIESTIKTCIQEKQAPLCWQKHQNSYLTFFIVWW